MKKICFLFILTLKIGYSQSVNFTLDDTQSKTQSYNKLKGEKLTVVDFWATWCKPCLQSIPHLISMQNEFKSLGVNFIGISVDGPRSIAKVAPLAESLKINYTVLLDFNNDIMRQFNVTNVPSLAIINDKNKIVYFHEGFISGEEKILKEKIVQLLNQQ